MTGYSDQAIEALLAQHRTAEAVAQVERAAAAGNADAGYRLAIWLLVGAPIPRDLVRARAVLRRTVEAGHPFAPLMEVALAANGSGAPADWRLALALLERAAARDAVAAQHLALIRAMDLNDDGDPRSLPEPEVLHRGPDVLRYRKLLTPAECEHIAQSAAELLQPAVVVDPRTGRMVEHPIRTSHNAVVGPTRESLPIHALLRRVAAASGTRVEQGEQLSLLRYTPGQQYRSHLDTLPHTRNQRIKTVLLYLNEGYRGGETRFDKLGLTVAGKGGDVVVFTNVLPDGSSDPRSQHSGLPVVQGAKWLATRWIRAHPYSSWNPE